MSIPNLPPSAAMSLVDPARRRWIAALGGLLVTGCSSTPPASDATAYSVRIAVDKLVNPDSRGRPSPILVGVYELKATDAFGLASFPALQDRAKETLGEDLVSLEQMVLVPGERRIVKRRANEMVHAVGFVAGYRQLEQSAWRSSVELHAPRRNALLSIVWPFSPDPPAIALRVGERSLVSDINGKNQ
ncbi:type VI secretion system lipoprotein TssJ [Paraburkholderia tagetis]|uniref:Type VI secretion system lipoprotein TssJ n=1 Tax=Paraburkholderia tagetis TaxID=2913261 RepID=A0A9X1RVS3_9BURK|nr:type VI secretion system lipoprotein TssJ [Paraburkholderia tagetis]MCG5077031.1 type VI secretion system lipoprotein TssJ [Paraburkholderia tagetis]